MKRILLLSFLLAAILSTVIPDLYKRSRDGLPDPLKSGIIATRLPSRIQIGFGSVDITGHVFYDDRLGALELPEESSLNPFLDLVRPAKDSVKTKRRRKVGRLYAKAMLFSDQKKNFGLLLSLDLPLLRQEQVKIVQESLSRHFGLNPGNILIFYPGFFAAFSISPEKLEAAAVQAVEEAQKHLNRSEFALLSPETPFKNAVYSPVNVPGTGIFRTPPLCGSLNEQGEYDASEKIYNWQRTFCEASLLNDSSSFFTVNCTTVVPQLLLFRKKGGKIMGGAILSPVTPCLAPPGHLQEDISSDYVYHLCDYLERKLGAPILFLRSPGSDIIPRTDAFSHPNAHRFGIQMGAAFLPLVRNALFERISLARFFFQEVRLPLKPEAALSPEEITGLMDRYRFQSEALKKVNIDLSVKREIQDRFLTPFFMLHYFKSFGVPGPLALKGFRLNRLLFLGLPGETDEYTGREIRKQFPGLPLCLADRQGSYLSAILPEAAYQGGYLPNLTPFDRKAEARLRETAITCIEQMKGRKGL
ncbi:MAG: hypothetical protein A2293_09720 [Elusimicrobia bacterium RIFOXYB2_FULL_49_7]|nr:MAG: hypothetical protein A2293_09720 [Elusimicrobia bacterium RIFOXYB2_FULL_49_7]